MQHLLDIRPAMKALAKRPGEFEWFEGSLRHIPSDHRFTFRDDGSVLLSADCACATLAISKDQAAEFRAAAETWTRDYWRPVSINRHFASHFVRPSAWRRFAALVTRRDPDDLDLGLSLPEDAEAIAIATETAPAPERVAA
ncbi:hypothetical protein [Chthonobacter albigriseus]|uniref:hypothetical protein n=1 Tax=Chthonobacter albigriseus TaxID=1683161 RepID=UPI0015EF5AEB|nr:hypothetical protein [Chthonobacter albigriseus]